MKKKIRMIVFAVCLISLIVSGVRLALIYHTYKLGNDKYKEIEQEVVKITVPEESSLEIAKATDKPNKVKEEKKTVKIEVDFNKLQNINKDIIGWICIPDSVINYPILKTDNNDLYLHKAYDLSDSIFGSIFMECSNSDDFSDFHTILYGHNMKNGSMFAALKKYQDETFLKEHDKIYIVTKDKTRIYKVFSYHVAKAGGEIYSTQFETEDVYKKFQDLLLKSSYKDLNTELKADDTIITLSTCTSGEDNRFVVHAKLIKS